MLLKRILMCLVAGSLWGCAAGTSSGILSGTVTYREDATLPIGSRVQVVLSELGPADSPAGTVAESNFLSDTQVPLFFSLEFDPARIDPARRYGVTARILGTGGDAVWASPERLPVLTFGAPNALEIVLERVGDRRPVTRTDITADEGTFVFGCDDIEFVARTGPVEAALFLPDRFVMMKRVPSGSGVRFEGDGVVFRGTGNEATLELDGVTYANCQRDFSREPWEDAKLRGADFRAAGSEPGWHLEIFQNDRIVLVTDYGSTRITVPASAPIEDTAAGRTVYNGRNDAHTIVVTLEPGPCIADNDQTLENRVSVDLDGRRITGCGMTLR